MNCPLHRKLLLFQFGPVHEELAPLFISASAGANCSITASLHVGSKLKKGDVFSGLAEKDLENHRVVYRCPDLTIDQLVDHILQVAGEADIQHVLFLTLQDPWTVSLARKVAAAGLRVFGVIHNVSKLLENQEVHHFWLQCQEPPLVLSKHVAGAVAKALNCDRESLPILSSVFLPSEHVLRQYQFLNNAQINIGVTGSINYANRTYPLLIETVLVLHERNAPLACRLVFHILGGGKDFTRLSQDISEAGLEKHFCLAQSKQGTTAIPYADYFQRLAMCDYVLCMDAPHYLSRKITSAVPTAISFGKPLICSEALSATYEVESMSISSGNLCSALARTARHSDHARYSSSAESIRREAVQQNERLIMALLSHRPPENK